MVSLAAIAAMHLWLETPLHPIYFKTVLASGDQAALTRHASQSKRIYSTSLLSFAESYVFPAYN